MPSTMNEFLENAFKGYKPKKIEEGYTSNELNSINVKAETVSVQVSDYDGNKTKFLGMNDKESLMALKKFIENRLKNIKK